MRSDRHGWAALAMALGMVIGLLPTFASAADHRDSPILTIRHGEAGDDLMFLATRVRNDLDIAVHSYSDPTDSAVLATFIVDCQPSGGSWLIVTNPAGEPAELWMTNVLTGEVAMFELPPGLIPPGSSGLGHEPVLIDSPLGPCDALVEPPLDRLPPIEGTATFGGIGRDCTDFRAPIAFEQSKAGRDYDRMVFYGQQDNDIIRRHPMVALDISSEYDEIHHVLLTGEDPLMIEGITFGGPQGTIPSGRRLEQRLDDFLIGGLEEATARAGEGKDLKAAARALGIRGDYCAYHVVYDVEGVPGSPGSGQLFLQLEPQFPVPPDSRFEIRLLGSPDPLDPNLAGPAAPIKPVELLSDQAGFGGLSIAANDDVLAAIIDGCATGAGRTIFVANRSGVPFEVPFELSVTDTLSGESQVVRIGDALPPSRSAIILDTSVFATCP